MESIKNQMDKRRGGGIPKDNRSLVVVVLCVCGRRQKMMEEFRKQAQLIFQQWETDLEKTRENEEKLQVIVE